MKKIITLITLLISVNVMAGQYKQSAYITNSYFTKSTVEIDGFSQPSSVFNMIRANDPSAGGKLVMNLLLDKGTHAIEIDMLDSKGTKFDAFKFNSQKADSDNYTFTITGSFGGRLGTNGIFFKAYTIHNGGEREHIGTIRLGTYLD
jgi:hypothetical protein